MGSVGTFLGYNIGKSALIASSNAQDVVGNNISNADTEGYTRENVDIVEGPPCVSDGLASERTLGQFGTGAATSSITRARDQYLDRTLRDSYSKQNHQSELENQLSSVQNAINEPSDNGLNTSLSKFFNSFGDLENNPENTGVRMAVVGSARSLASSFNGTRKSMDAVKSQVTDTIGQDVTQINTYAKEVAQLNVQIKKAVRINQQPNALLDKRDQILDKLAKLVNITTSMQPDSSVNVTIGGLGLISDRESREVTLDDINADEGHLRGGKLAGDVDALASVNAFEGQVDDLAAELMGQVNAIHESGAGLDGTTGLKLFTGTGASSMAINSDIEQDTRKLAAASKPDTDGAAPPPGDASNAVKIYQLKDTPIADGELAGQTIPHYYRQVVAKVASAAQNASTLNDALTATVSQFEQQRSSSTSVNIDEEATKMLQYQRCYQAAAKVISSNDDMIVSLLGMVR